MTGSAAPAVENLFHLALRHEWDEGRDRYEPGVLVRDGHFIAFEIRYLPQVLARTPEAAWLLEFDPSSLEAGIIWHYVQDLNLMLPHVLGPVDRAAIVSAQLLDV
jgi:hypothetical protein